MPDIFHEFSSAELEKEINDLTAKDQRSLPLKAKVFAAVAKIQKFDMLPEVVEVAELDALVGAGAKELNRGLAGVRGVAAVLYAKDLLHGTMYPGTLSAYGNGIYLATPMRMNPNNPAFAKVSAVALGYTKGEGAGVLVRAALKADAKILEYADLWELYLQNRSRALKAGVKDLGAFTAALGYDAYYLDGIEHPHERTWTVVNRGALTFQKIALQVRSGG